MHIKHFTMTPQRVPDPMRPGKSATIGRLTDSGNSSLSHQGVNYEPDENGWFEVPLEVGTELCKFRVKGSGFYTPGEVVDQVRLGAMENADAPVPPKPKVAAAKPATKKAEDDPKD